MARRACRSSKQRVRKASPHRNGCRRRRSVAALGAARHPSATAAPAVGALTNRVIISASGLAMLHQDTSCCHPNSSGTPPTVALFFMRSQCAAKWKRRPLEDSGLPSSVGEQRCTYPTTNHNPHMPHIHPTTSLRGI